MKLEKECFRNSNCNVNLISSQASSDSTISASALEYESDGRYLLFRFENDSERKFNVTIYKNSDSAMMVCETNQYLLYSIINVKEVYDVSAIEERCEELEKEAKELDDNGMDSIPKFDSQQLENDSETKISIFSIIIRIVPPILVLIGMVLVLIIDSEFIRRFNLIIVMIYALYWSFYSLYHCCINFTNMIEQDSKSSGKLFFSFGDRECFMYTHVPHFKNAALSRIPLQSIRFVRGFETEVTSSHTSGSTTVYYKNHHATLEVVSLYDMPWVARLYPGEMWPIIADHFNYRLERERMQNRMPHLEKIFDLESNNQNELKFEVNNESDAEKLHSLARYCFSSRMKIDRENSNLNITFRTDKSLFLYWSITLPIFFLVISAMLLVIAEGLLGIILSSASIVLIAILWIWISSTRRNKIIMNTKTINLQQQSLKSIILSRSKINTLRDPTKHFSSNSFSLKAFNINGSQIYSVQQLYECEAILISSALCSALGISRTEAPLNFQPLGQVETV